MCNLSENILERGLIQGREEGKFVTLVSLMNQGLLKIGDAAKQMDITEVEFARQMKQAQKF